MQGNPNYYRSAPYSQVWRHGYYVEFAPELEVEVYDDTSSIAENLAAVSTRLREVGKGLVVLGHLLDPADPHPVRKANNDSVRAATESLPAELGVTFYDQSHLVGEHGFRVLADGTTDIHHLPEDALATQGAELLSLCR